MSTIEPNIPSSSAAGGGPGPIPNPNFSKNSFEDDDIVWVLDDNNKNNRNWFPGEVIKENTADKTYDIQFNQEPHQGVSVDRITEFDLKLGDDVIVLNEEEDKFSNDNLKNGKISGINDNNHYILNKDKYDVTYDDNTSEQNIKLAHLAETDAQMLLNKGLFTSDFFKSIVTEFDRLGPDAVSELASEHVQLDTSENILQYILSPDKKEKTYSYTTKDKNKDIDWYFKRFFAGDYNENKSNSKFKINLENIIGQVYLDAVDRGMIIRLPNDNNARFQFKNKPAGLLKYYNYIIELVNGLKQNEEADRQDIVDMFFSVSNQGFNAPFYIDAIGFTLGEFISRNMIYIATLSDELFKTNKLLYSFLYGNLENDGPIYDPKTQTIQWTIYKQIGSIEGKYQEVAFKMLVLELEMNLETKALNLVARYSKPVGLYKHGVYIGETIYKIEGQAQDKITIIANGQGIFYVYDYKIAGDYPRAKLYGTFENGSLKKGASVGVEFYDSMADFNAKNDIMEGGVMAALDRQKFDGKMIIPEDISLDNVDHKYLFLLLHTQALQVEDLFDPNGYFMKDKIGPYYTIDRAKYEKNPFKISDILDLPEDFKGDFHKTLIHNRENNSALSITLESKKGKTVYDILGFMFFPTIDVIKNTPLPTLFSYYFTDKVYRDISRGQAFAINKNGDEYKETGKYWGNYDSDRLDVYKHWLHEKLLDTTFTTEIERENYINAIFYASQQFMDIMSNYFNNENLQYQPISKDFINVFYTNRKIISIGRKYFLGMAVFYRLFDDYTSKFNTPYCGTLAITAEYNLKEGICKILITPILETYFKLGNNNKAGGKYVGQTQKQKVSNDENELEIENFIPNGKGKMYFYLADKTNLDEQLNFSDEQLVMTLESDKWANGDLLKGTRVTINYIDNLGTKPEYKGRLFNIELSQELSLNSIINDGLNFIDTEVKHYVNQITKITKGRADVKAVEEAVKNGHYLRVDNRIGDKSHQGIVLFSAPNTVTMSDYVYIGPILPNGDKTVSISKKYGKILRFSKDTNTKHINPNVSDKKYTVFIKPGKENSRDWDKFVLKPNFSRNYSNTGELPLEWSIVRFGSVFDNFKFSLTNNSLGQKGIEGQKDIASELVTRVFRDLMVDPIANDLSLTKGLFEDTQRVIKMEKMIYIQVLIYFKILFVLLKRYDSNLNDIPQYVSMKPLLNKLYEDYDSFTEFNEEVSDDYKYTTNSADTTDNIDEELNTAPVSTLLSPIILSMEPKTNASVFEPINQNIDDPELLRVYVLKAALLVLQNLGIVLQMYMNILGRMPVDEDANMVANYNPFALYPMYQKLGNVYNTLYQFYNGLSKDKINDNVIISNTLTKYNSATINKYLVSLALRIGASSSLMSYGGYMSRKNKHKSYKHKFSKRISKNGNTNAKTRNYRGSKRGEGERERQYTRKL